MRSGDVSVCVDWGVNGGIGSVGEEGGEVSVGRSALNVKNSRARESGSRDIAGG